MLVTGRIQLRGGSIDMDGKGYRGVALQRTSSEIGDQGEGDVGTGLKSTMPHSSGGGGGVLAICKPVYGGPGAGGGHGAVGNNGLSSVCTSSARGGEAVGTLNQTNRILFGGAGGQGAATSDGFGSAGANGGGIVHIGATEVSVLSGYIKSHGSMGGLEYNFGGCGDGGGGGGAGGAVSLRFDFADLGCPGGVQARGGVGGDNSTNCGMQGGNGSIGRVTSQQLKHNVLLSTYVDPRGGGNDNISCRANAFDGAAFEPFYVSEVCAAGSWNATGNDTRTGICSIDPFRRSVDVQAVRGKAGCVIKECIQGMWSTSGNDAKLLRCSEPLAQFVKGA